MGSQMKTTVINKYILLYNSIYSTRFYVIMWHEILYFLQNLLIPLFLLFIATRRGAPRRDSSCVTPAGTSNELDAQNEWEEHIHTLAAHFCTAVILGSIRKTLYLKLFMRA